MNEQAYGQAYGHGIPIPMQDYTFFRYDDLGNFIQITSEADQTEEVPQYLYEEPPLSDIPMSFEEVRTYCEQILRPAKLERRMVSYSVSTFSSSADSWGSDLMKIGDDTTVPMYVYDNIYWKDYKQATRKLMSAVFPRSLLATHTVCGLPSSSQSEQPDEISLQLDPIKVEAIIRTVMRESEVSRSMVETVMIEKCAEAKRLSKLRLMDSSDDDEDTFWDGIDLTRF